MPRPRTAAAAAGSIRDLLRRPGLVRALTVSCVVLAAVDISLVYLPVLGTERDIAAGDDRRPPGRPSRGVHGLPPLPRPTRPPPGSPRLLTGSIGVAALGMALVPVPMPLWLLVVVVAATGLGLGAGQPLTMSWLADATPPGLRGRAMSLRLTGNRLGQVVVPTVAGRRSPSAPAPPASSGSPPAPSPRPESVSRRVTSPPPPNPLPATVGD